MKFEDNTTLKNSMQKKIEMTPEDILQKLFEEAYSMKYFFNSTQFPIKYEHNTTKNNFEFPSKIQPEMQITTPEMPITTNEVQPDLKIDIKLEDIPNPINNNNNLDSLSDLQKNNQNLVLSYVNNYLYMSNLISNLPKDKNDLI